MEAIAVVVGSTAVAAVRDADLSFATWQDAVTAPRTLARQEHVAVATGLLAANLGLTLAGAEERRREAAALSGLTPADVAETVISVYTAGL